MSAGRGRRGLLGATGVAALLALLPGVPRALPTALPSELRGPLPAARLQGAGTLRALGFRIAELRLWSAERVDPAAYASLPLALELQYHRSLDGTAIAERSIDEMDRQSALPADTRMRWRDALRRLLPDVRPGDRLTGLLLNPSTTHFFHNGRPLGEVAGDDFAVRFFGIWLAPRTSEPALRAQLLGLPA